MQATVVATRLVGSAVVAVGAYTVADLALGPRLPERGREGLDINSHGESAYRSWRQPR